MPKALPLTIKKIIINKLNEGLSICHGEADKITKSQSGARKLREVAQEMELFFFYAKPTTKGRSEYKVFSKHKKNILITDFGEGYVIHTKAKGLTAAKESKPYKSKKMAEACIYQVGCR